MLNLTRKFIILYNIFERSGITNANTKFIRCAVDQFNWEQAFSNKIVTEKAHISNKRIPNILSNFITHKTVIINDRDVPWFNDKIKALINVKNETFKNFCRSRNYQERLIDLIETSKQKYHCRMTNKSINTQKSCEVYWSLLKRSKNSLYPSVIP